MLSIPRYDSIRPEAFEAAKWLALVTMTIDHYGKIVDPSVLRVTHWIGRISFPLFAGIVAMRIALFPATAAGYARRLAFWAVVSQPIFVLAGRPWSDGNIFFTLLLGVLAHETLLLVGRGHVVRGALLLAGITAAACYAEFRIAGVAMIPLMARAASFDEGAALWLIGPLGVLANLSFASPPLLPGDFWALGATPVALASVRMEGRVPRLPKYFFYAYYPAHLFALHWIDLHL